MKKKYLNKWNTETAFIENQNVQTIKILNLQI